MSPRGIAVVLALLVSACAPTPVQIDLTFPREENFLFSEFGQLLVYEVDPDTGLGDCPRLLGALRDNDLGAPTLLTDREPICNFREGGISFVSVPPGPHAYVALAWDEADTVLLEGCTIAEAYDGAPPVEVDLYPTAGYADATRGRALTCSNASDKCTRGCR